MDFGRQWGWFTELGEARSAKGEKSSVGVEFEKWNETVVVETGVGVEEEDEFLADFPR